MRDYGYARSQLATRRVGALLLSLAISISGCHDDSSAPTDASIEVRVNGVTGDQGIIVGAYVQDLGFPYNRLSNPIAIGSSVFFHNLGAGFKIEVGVENLGTYGCSVDDVSVSGLAGFGIGDKAEVNTESGIITVTFDLLCESATLDITVAGLPGGDSASMTLAGHDSNSGRPGSTIDFIRVPNGLNRSRREPYGDVWILPLRVVASDSMLYEAVDQRILLTSRDTTAVTVQYQPSANQTSNIVITILGWDTTKHFLAFMRDRVAPFRRDSLPITESGTVSWNDVGAGRELDIGIEGLSAYNCTARLLNSSYTSAGNSLTLPVVTYPGVTNRYDIDLSCRAALIDLQVAGLPAGDSARISLQWPGDSAIVWMGNASRFVPVAKFLMVSIVPNGLTALDGRVFQAPPQVISTLSRDTTPVVVAYTASACAHYQPLAWYQLNGVGGDYTGNNNHGTVVGATSALNRHGVVNGAMSFDGVDDYIDLGDRFNSLILPFSIAAWVFQPAGARGQLRAIFATDDEPGRYAGIWLQTALTGEPLITFADGGTVGADHRRTLQAANPLPTDTWVHLTATVRAANDMTLYVNGSAVAGTYSGTGGPLVHSAAPATIGRLTIVPDNRPWLGMLDELRVYNCSLDPSEVALLALVR